ncbi:MAG: SDR family oxidoreductase [Terriglobales bacterium]
MKILVTGATGRVGGSVVANLAKRNVSVRALTREGADPSKVPPGAEIARGDLSDPPSILKALEGIDKMFLLIANVADEFTQAVSAYGLARRAGVRHITYLSVLQADRFLDVPHFAAKAALEATIKNYDVPFTILRPGYFMQNDAQLEDPLTGPGVYPMPLGDAGIAAVDVRDIGEAAAISLTQDGHAGKSYDLVSKEPLSGPRAAAIWSETLRKEIRYAGHANFDAFEEQLRKRGSPSWLAYDLRIMFQGYVERGFAPSQSDAARFADLLGHEPRTYRSYAGELAKQWAAAGNAAERLSARG